MLGKSFTGWSFVLLFLAATPAPSAWQTVVVDDDLMTDLYGPGNSPRPQPACSGAPVPARDEDGLPIFANGAPVFYELRDGFRFFVDFNDEGPDAEFDIVLYFGGGGACWDEATCLGSLLGPRPTYSPAIAETAEYLERASNGDFGDAGGFLVRANPANPFAGRAKIYIPYCTGDVHVGSGDQPYEYSYSSPQLGNGTVVGTVHHRGFDNLEVVLKWLERQRDLNQWTFANKTLAGSSAGGYGVLLNAPVIIDSLGGSETDYSLVIDSSNGVLTNGFLDRVFGPAAVGTSKKAADTGVWQARENLDGILREVIDLDAGLLWPTAIRTVADEYPNMRISQSTAAYDAIQALVRITMKQVDRGSYDPFTVPSERQIALTALLDWSLPARIGMLSIASTTPNYRYYLGAGEGHVHLFDPPGLVPTTNFYAENSARGIYYTDWLSGMLESPPAADWRNLSCFPNCLPD